MDENKVFEAYFELPDGYQVQLMVLKDFPGGRSGRRQKLSVFRSRIWIGHQEESDPRLHRSQEHAELRLAIDACHSMLLASATYAIDSPDALAVVQQQVDEYFLRKEKLVV